MIRTYLFILSALLASCSFEGEAPEIEKYSPSENWIVQVDSLIMPYWMTEEALGSPAGNYNTYRNNDGSVLNPSSYDFNEIPEYIRNYIITGTDSLTRQFIRMNSRQIYAYCIAFHITGNENYLVNAKLGLDYLIKKGAFSNKSVVTYYLDDKPYPGHEQRTVQDLAYGLLGPTVYYYLTRDPEILELILPIKQEIMNSYYEDSELTANSKLMKWTLQDYESDSAHYMNLLAPMDMINAHLLLMAHSIPDSLKTEYKDDLGVLANSIKDNYYNEWSNSFLGNLNHMTLFEGSSDLGHSIKNFWMLYMIGQLINDNEMVEFASSNGKRLLEQAYDSELGRWGSMYADSSLRVVPNILSWQYAEFDQTAVSFSLDDNSLYDKYLKSTFNVWYDKLIDHDGKEIYWGLNESNEPNNLGFKIGMWKNGFHSMEHALIGLIGSSTYYQQETKLYYAIDQQVDIIDIELRPYYYRFNDSSKKVLNTTNGSLTDLQIVEVTFTDIY